MAPLRKPSEYQRRAALKSGQKRLWPLERLRDRAGQLDPMRSIRFHHSDSPVVMHFNWQPNLCVPIADHSEIPRLPPRPVLNKANIIVKPKPKRDLSLSLDDFEKLRLDEEDEEKQFYEFTKCKDPEIKIHEPDCRCEDLCAKRIPTLPDGECQSLPSNITMPKRRAIMPPADWERPKHTYIFDAKSIYRAKPLGDTVQFPEDQDPEVDTYRTSRAHNIVPFRDVPPTTLDGAAIEREIIRFSQPGYTLYMPELLHFKQIYNTLAKACLGMLAAQKRYMKSRPGDHSAGMSYLGPIMLREKGVVFYRVPSPLLSCHDYDTIKWDRFPDEEEKRLDREFQLEQRADKDAEAAKKREESRASWKRCIERKEFAIRCSGLSAKATEH